MVLGNYWSYSFPEGLYPFRFFTGIPSLGGHADSPAEIIARVQVSDADQLLHALETLIAQHRDAYLIVSQRNNFFQIISGGYQLHDFEFELCMQVEEILLELGVSTCTKSDLAGGTTRYLKHPGYRPLRGIQSQLLKLVAGTKGKFQAESNAIRLDCNLPHPEKPSFLEALLAKAEAWNIGIIYYRAQLLEHRTNLMLFFSNGRQGVHLHPKQHVDVEGLEADILVLMDQFDVQPKHQEGQNYYPSVGYTTLLNREDGYIPNLEISLHAESGEKSDSPSAPDTGMPGAAPRAT